MRKWRSRKLEKAPCEKHSGAVEKAGRNGDLNTPPASPISIDIAGGGLAGLGLAIETRLKLGGAVRIRIFDHRWTTAEDGSIRWRDQADGNNRRRQVITIQSKVWSLLSPEVQRALFVKGNYTETWPNGPDSPESVGRPRNIQIRWIESRLLELAQKIGGIELVPERYSPPADWKDIDFLIIADGARSRTREELKASFGTPSRELFSIDGSGYDEVVLGLEVQSDLLDEHTVPLTVAQNRFLFNPLDRKGFINMRLTPAEASEVVGLGSDGPVSCIQGSPCVMRPGPRGFTCETHNAVFKPSVDPTSFLWPRIVDGLRYFGVPAHHGLLGITSFTLGMTQHQRFVAEIAPGTFAIVLGDAGPGNFHFWPGRGGNAALKGMIAAVREIVRLSEKRVIRLADMTRLEGFLHQLQFREKSRAWTTMLMPTAEGTPYLIHDRIEAGLRSDESRETLLASMLSRIEAIKSRLEPRMGQLPDAQWYADRLIGLDNRTLAVFMETDSWFTAQVGGEEVSVDTNFPFTEESSDVQRSTQ